MSIVRVKHNRENPYVQINKEALWNQNLSLKAIGLWAKCLSRPDNWTFRVAELAKRGVEGRRAIYSAIDELEKERYVLKLKHYEKKDTGAFDGGGVEYIFFEFPYTDQERDDCIEEFKKCFRQCGFGDVRGGDLQKSTLLNKDSLPIIEDNQYRESASPPPSPSLSLANAAQDSRPSAPPIKEIPQEAKEMAEELLKKVKAIHPKLKEPNLDKWAKEMDLLHRADKREWSEIKDMIKWAFEDAFWVKIIQSPEGLRRNWDKMAVKQAKVDNKGITIEKNRTYAQQIKAFLEKEGDGKIIWLGIDFVQDRRTGDSIKFDLNHDTFKGIVNKWFGIREK
jgi:hypothetical protein